MLTEKAKKAVREIAVVGCFVLAFSCAVEAAIPSEYPPSKASFAKQSGYSGAECKAARAKLAKLTSDDYKALKAKTKTNEQVVDALAQYADNEESAAGKFALLQDAFQQYVLGKSVDNFPKRRNVEEAMKLHAAMWYKFALGKDAFKGNEKTIIEKRVAETEKLDAAEQADKELVAKKMATLDPIKLILSKNNFMEFLGCPAGEFTMGKTLNNNSVDQAHQVVITRPFWLSKFQITRKQWKAFGGGRERAEHDQLINVFGTENGDSLI